jgi:hypothetical protein
VSGDISCDFESILHNLEALIQSLPLSRPGCWAYGDMLVLGSPSVTFEEGRTQFGAWAVLSSPLILTLNLTDAELMRIWLPVVSNERALAVNQNFFGLAGGLFDTLGALWFLFKPQSYDATSVAVLIVNTGSVAVNATLDTARVPHFAPHDKPVSVFDIWAGKNALTLEVHIAPHDSVFFLLQTGTAEPPFHPRPVAVHSNK